MTYEQRVEAAARELYEHLHSAVEGKYYWDWDRELVEVKDHYIRMVRVSLAAAYPELHGSP